MIKKHETARKPADEGRKAMDKFISGMCFVSTPITGRRPKQRPNIAERTDEAALKRKRAADLEDTLVLAGLLK